MEKAISEFEIFLLLFFFFFFEMSWDRETVGI